MIRIYVASSWRNEKQQELIQFLSMEIGDDDTLGLDIKVYDFKRPYPGYEGFGWGSLDSFGDEGSITVDTPIRFHSYVITPGEGSRHKAVVEHGFYVDMDALYSSDLCILLLPCGRSAHIEAGWAKGRGKKLWIILSEEKFEPELMYKMADEVFVSLEEFYESALGKFKELEKEFYGL